jgi:hypothetical protein
LDFSDGSAPDERKGFAFPSDLQKRLRLRRPLQTNFRLVESPIPIARELPTMN